MIVKSCHYICIPALLQCNRKVAGPKFFVLLLHFQDQEFVPGSNVLYSYLTMNNEAQMLSVKSRNLVHIFNKIQFIKRTSAFFCFKVFRNFEFYITNFYSLCVWGLVDLSLISRLGVGRTAFRDFGDGGITRLRWFIGWAELGTWVYH